MWALNLTIILAGWGFVGCCKAVEEDILVGHERM